MFAVACLYLLLLLLISYLMRSRFNGHWLLTLFLFSPRWVVGLPLAILIPVTLCIWPRLAWFYLWHFAVIAFVILGFELRGFQPKIDTAVKTRVNVLTCNIGGGTLDEDLLATLVRERKVDVVMLQECHLPDATSFYGKLGWNFKHEHSIAIGSSLKLISTDVVNRPLRRHPRPPVAVDCGIRLPNGETFHAISVHLPTFRPVLSKMQEFHFLDGAKAMKRLGEVYCSLAEKVHTHLANLETPTIVAGDFNVPIESVYYQNYWAAMTNAHSKSGLGLGHTKFTRWHGVRIDHVLVDQCWLVSSSQVGPHLGGDHRPVLTQLFKISSPDQIVETDQTLELRANE